MLLKCKANLAANSLTGRGPDEGVSGGGGRGVNRGGMDEAYLKAIDAQSGGGGGGGGRGGGAPDVMTLDRD